uniref:Small ribosomal subunit protein mS26 n=1 Tax=Clastoptera arizonana TaxID=38151 RepID=A0A1B6DPR9_9HEMI
MFKKIAENCIFKKHSASWPIPFNPTNYQFLRWYRKPRWVPVAPSKMFRVPERKRYPAEETVEVIRLNNIYRTTMKSLRLYFKTKTQSMTTAPEVIQEQTRKLEEHHKICVEENDRWNKEVAELRKARLLKSENEKRIEIANRLKEHETEQLEIKEKFEELVRKEKENSKYFITEKNIDEAIEKALNSTVDFNSVIDTNGNLFEGRKTLPTKTSDTNDVFQRIEASN